MARCSAVGSVRVGLRGFLDLVYVGSTSVPHTVIGNSTL